MLFLEKNSKVHTQTWAIPEEAFRITQVFMESCLSYYIVGPALMAFQHALSQLFQSVIKFCICHIMIWRSIEQSYNAASKSRQEIPADKRQIQYKRTPFISAHHLLTPSKCFPALHPGIFCQKIGDHPVFIGFYDTRYHKQQTP